MNFKKEFYFWIVVMVVFLYIWIETEDLLSAFLFTGIGFGILYLIYLLITKFITKK